MLSRFVASAAKKATTLSWRQIHVASVLNAIEVRVIYQQNITIFQKLFSMKPKFILNFRSKCLLYLQQ